MQPAFRQASRLRLACVGRRLPVIYAAQPTRLAHSTYGDKQSGHEQGLDLKNPKSHLEHPGPEPPSTKGSPKSASSSSSSQTGEGKTTSRDAEPKIHRPKSQAESQDPEVREHNEDMEKRHERSVNQLSEDDNKVDKNFWKGDVGPKEGVSNSSKD